MLALRGAGRSLGRVSAGAAEQHADGEEHRGNGDGERSARQMQTDRRPTAPTIVAATARPTAAASIASRLRVTMTGRRGWNDDERAHEQDPQVAKSQRHGECEGQQDS